MREVIKTLDPRMPKGYEMFEGLEVVKQSGGNLRYNGILEIGDDDSKIDRKVLLPDVAEMWGYSSDSADWERRKANPQEWWRDKQITELVQQVNEKVQVISEMSERLERIEERLAALIDTNSATQTMLSDRDDRIIELERQLAERNAAATPPVEPTVVEPEAETIAEPEVTRVETDEVSLGEPVVPEETVVVSTPLVDEPTVDLPRERRERRRLLGRQRSETVTTTVDERDVRTRRGRVVAFGAAVLAALSVGIGAYTLHEVEEIEHRQSTPDHIQPNHNEEQEQNMDQEESGQGSSVSGGGGSHVEFYNPVSGNHSVGVELAKKLRWKQINGKYYSLVNDNGRVVVGRVGWDRQGNLDQSTRRLLKNQDYKLDQDGLTYATKNGKTANHYMTDVKQG